MLDFIVMEMSKVNHEKRCSLAKLLLDNLLLNSLLLDSSITNHVQSCRINQPVTLKVAVTCVHARACFLAGRRRGGLRMFFCRYFNALFSFFHNMAIPILPGIANFMNNW